MAIIDTEDIASYFYKDIEDLINSYKNSKIGKSLILALKRLQWHRKIITFWKVYGEFFD